MLVEIGFRPNNLFISNATKYFPISSPSYVQLSHHHYHNHYNHNHLANDSPNNKHDLKYFQTFLNSRKKKMKRSMTMPYQESDLTRVVGGGGGGGGGGGFDTKTPISKCLDTIESDLARLGKHQSLHPFKNLRLRKEGGTMKGKSSARTAENGDGFVTSTGTASTTRVAVEFPMILNVGSIYSSHVVVYLDP